MQVACYLSPPQVAKRFSVDAHKVLAWIRSGQLRAIDVATSTGGRPRYRIAPADLAQFEASRAVQPPAPRVRRRRTDPNIIEFF